jgi:gliding motility-associated-like protein
MMGGDMSYKCLGNGKYKITAKIYRDCRGVSFNSPEFGVFAGTNGGNGCGSSNLSISRTGIKDVTPRCTTASSPCSPQNTYGTGEGIEEHTGTYWIKLIVTTDKGCKDSSMKKVVIGPDIIIFVPDAFTPDNAGPNENNTFKPYVINNKTYEMLIFNRWGEKMYETTDLTKGWDGNYKGQPAQDGVYVYKMMVTSLEDKVFQYNGTFTLIR